MEAKLFLSHLGLNLSEDFRLAILASEWHDILKLCLLLQNCNSCMLFLVARFKNSKLSLLPVTPRNKMKYISESLTVDFLSSSLIFSHLMDFFKSSINFLNSVYEYLTESLSLNITQLLFSSMYLTAGSGLSLSRRNLIWTKLKLVKHCVLPN